MAAALALEARVTGDGQPHTAQPLPNATDRKGRGRGRGPGEGQVGVGGGEMWGIDEALAVIGALTATSRWLFAMQYCGYETMA